MVLDAVHRVSRVEKQVQDDLLQLRTVGAHGRQAVREFCVQDCAAPRKLAGRDADHITPRIVQANWLGDRGKLARKRTGSAGPTAPGGPI